MRKAKFEVGSYTVKEGPTGGWSVNIGGNRISIHETSAEAVAAAKRYMTAEA